MNNLTIRAYKICQFILHFNIDSFFVKKKKISLQSLHKKTKRDNWSYDKDKQETETTSE